MKIALDAMGSDHGPEPVIEGALLAVDTLDVEVVLVGKEDIVKQHLNGHSFDSSGITVKNADEVVEMDEEATSPIRKKKNSSIRVAGNLLREDKADGLVSAGNTGASMVTAKLVVGQMEGIDRPPLASVFPTLSGWAVVLDIGANVDCKPHHLRQFAVMGDVYCRAQIGKSNPRIGLLGIGEEATKGNELTREVFEVLKNTDLNFIGNVEGNDIFQGNVDVAVCDGFVGNIALKIAESISEAMGEMLKEELSKSLLSRLGTFLAKPAFRRFENRVDYSEYGGAPLLGIEDVVIICHGKSSPKAIKNAIKVAKNLYNMNITEKIHSGIEMLTKKENAFGESS